MGTPQHRTIAVYSVALAATAVAAGLRLVLNPILRDSSHFLTFYLSVALAATFGGLGPALWAVALGTVGGCIFLFYDGAGRFHADDVTRLILFLFTGTFMALLGSWAHSARRSAEAESRYARAAEERTHHLLTEVSESERRYRIVAEYTHDWEFWQAPDGRFIYCSPACGTLSGYAAAAFCADPQLLQRIIHPDDRSTYEAHRGTDQICHSERVEFRIIRPDGGVRWIEHLCQPIYEDGQFMGIRGSNRDITDRKETAEALAAAKLAAEQANAAKDHFLAILSHELRTPLTPVLAAVSMLREDRRCDDEVRDVLATIQRNVEAEARLIDDLLDVTRIAKGKIELARSIVEVESIIARAVEICRGEIESRGLHFGLDYGDDGPYLVHADAPRLQQVFWNLLKNAIKFTPPGGCIALRCRKIDGSGPGGYILVEVADSGRGIDAPSIARIFNAFEQGDPATTRQYGGLGLGLAICKGLVEMHGGELCVCSDGPGRGSVFTVRLPLPSVVSGPLSAAADRFSEATDSGQLATDIRPLHILLVEDHADTARIMKRLLEAQGHRVEVAAGVATALDLAASSDFDLLLSDIGLPDGDGIDLMRKLRSRGWTVPGIALSGHAQEQDIRRTRQVGFCAHLSKPISRHQLTQAIAAAVPQPRDLASGT